MLTTFRRWNLARVRRMGRSGPTGKGVSEEKWVEVGRTIEGGGGDERKERRGEVERVGTR